MPAFVTQGITQIRSAVAAIVTNVGFSTDNTAFNSAQTRLDPSASGSNLIKTATIAVVDFATFDATATVNGTTDTVLQGKSIFTIALMFGAAVTSILTRYVRAVGIGVQAGDQFTLGSRYQQTDATP